MSKKSNKQYVIDYCKKNNKPDPKLCPRLILGNIYRKNKEPYLKFYFNDTGAIMAVKPEPKTGRYERDPYHTLNKLEISNNQDMVRRPRSGELYTMYAKYHSRRNCLEIGMIGISLKMGIEGEIRPWDWKTVGGLGERIFVFNGDPVIYNEHGDEWNPGKSKFNVNLNKYLKNTYKYFQTDHKLTKDAIEKFAGVSEYSWTSWMNIYKSYKRSVHHPNLHKYDFITETWDKLTPVNEVEEKIIKFSNDPEVKSLLGKAFRAVFCYYDKIDDTLGVIRLLRSSLRYSSNIEDSQFFEATRIYLGDTIKAVAIENIREDTKEYNIMPGGKRYYTYGTFLNINLEDLLSNKIIVRSKISEMQDLIEGNSSHGPRPKIRVDYVPTILKMVKHPFYEMLIKSGYPHLAYDLRSETLADLKKYLSANIDRVRGTLTYRMGLNKTCLQVLDELHEPPRGYSRRNYILGTIATLRQLFKNQEVNSWDYPTAKANIKGCYNLVSSMPGRSSDQLSYLVLCGNDYSVPYNMRGETKPEEIKLIKRMVKHPNSDLLFVLYKDIISSARRIVIPHFYNQELITALGYDWMTMDWFYNQVLALKKIEDFRRLHDLLTTAINAINTARRPNENKNIEANWAKIKDKCNEYEEENESFLIKLPDTLGDLSYEGSVLSHCVSSYKDNVASGHTIILFLRNKVAPEIPFYTIEVCNGEVRQIHGKHNCWLGNNPECVQFVADWVKKHNLYCDKKILLCKSHGYSACSDMLDAAQYNL